MGISGIVVTALIALLMAGPVAAQNCQTFYNPALPMPVSDHYECYQRFVWYNQGKGSWCARDWYRSCMHSGWHDAQSERIGNSGWQDENGNPITNSPDGWVTGYSSRDDGRVAPQKIYVSGGQIIVYPYVCRGSLKKSPGDPGQRIQSNDALAQEYFPDPTLAEIRRYISSGACNGCAGQGNLMGNGC